MPRKTHVWIRRCGEILCLRFFVMDAAGPRGSASAGTAPRPRRLFPAADSAFRAEPSGAPGSRSRRLRTAAVFGSICSGPLIRQNLGELFGAWRRQTCGRQIFSRAKRSSRADCPLGGRSGAYKENRAGSPDFSPNRPCWGGFFIYVAIETCPFPPKGDDVLEKGNARGAPLRPEGRPRPATSFGRTT